ncbi:hypothetical protein JN531_010580 [Flagellatimonas centrodinii]|uniref:hypothetical protein n=1 Tax=Flagellatimonas centrodinii TaxID=2806210 RepID=UPI001FED9D9E|nr:hypothetical protein [Flagellatimonas centrodinii]ULQ45565.1 hypothetical protein JN531_010580 [Flagellatimonas centrodinii]
MKLKTWMLLPLALTLAACSDNDDNGGGGSAIAGVGGATNCTVTVPMSVTGELTPMYSWDVPDSDDGVFNLSVIRVENIEFLSSNPQACVPSSAGGSVDERCEIAYARSSGPDLSNPEVPQNTVTSPVMHGAAGSGISIIALTQESPLENGVEYQASVVRALDNNSAQACGCMRFTAGTAASSDTLCGS